MKEFSLSLSLSLAYDKHRSSDEFHNDVHVLIHVIDVFESIHSNEQYAFDDIVNDEEYVDLEYIVHKVYENQR